LKVRTGATVTIYLPKTVIATLEKVAQKTGKTKSGVAAEAVLDKYAT
jgi:predicted transcriptional regulator